MRIKNTGTKPVFLESGATLAPGSTLTINAKAGKALLKNQNLTEVKKTTKKR